VFQPDGVGESEQNVGLKPDLRKAICPIPRSLLRGVLLQS
jgi:hypothetical protein